MAGGRTAGAEVHLLRTYAHHVGGRGPRRVKELACPAGLRIELLRVGPAILERGEQRLPGSGMHRGRGGRVEVARMRHPPNVSSVGWAGPDTLTPAPPGPTWSS